MSNSYYHCFMFKVSLRFVFLTYDLTVIFRLYLSAI